MKRSLATILLLGVLMLTGAGCSSSEPATPAPTVQPVTLQYWGVFTDTDDMALLTSAFSTKYPNIQIQYRKFRPEEYEQKLLEAFAEDRGPDLFTIHNTWLEKYKTKLTPMPAKIPYVELTKTGSGLNEKTVPISKETTGLSLKQMRDLFVQTVEADTMSRVSATSTQTGVFALPFYMDTLAMYYNKDILAQSAITKPAVDWNQLRAHVKSVTRYVKDDVEQLTQPGVALGTGRGVHRSGDILMALMMQNGARLTNDSGGFAFNMPAQNQARDEMTPGVRALRFYLDFARPNSESYSWNPEQGDALDAFASGKLAYYFGYSYDMSTIRSKNPRLNFDVAPLPQFDKPINIANYWMEAVSVKSKYKNEAWLFIQQTATNKDVLTKFLKQTRRASALNEVIEAQKEDVDVSVFAKQSLTARNWYRGKDSAAADLILVETIDNTRTRLLNPNEEYNVEELMQDALNRAAARLNDTL